MQIKLKEWLEENGYSTADDALAEYSQLDDLYPACAATAAKSSRTDIIHTAHRRCL